MSEVEWRAVPGREGRYEVARDGRVRSLTRVVRYVNRHGTLVSRPARGVVLRPKRNPSGHLQLTLEGCQYAWVHHLVLEAFVGPRPVGLEALHGDGNPANNNVDNLRWGTRRENLYDAVAHGVHGMARRTHCPRGHELIQPNLVRSKLPRRQCLVCDRAKRSAWPRGHSAEWMQDADDRYRRIMAGAMLDAPRHATGQGSARHPAQVGPGLARATDAPGRSASAATGRC